MLRRRKLMGEPKTLAVENKAKNSPAQKGHKSNKANQLKTSPQHTRTTKIAPQKAPVVKASKNQKQTAIFISRPYIRFSDNVKYAFLHYQKYGQRFTPIFGSWDKDETDQLKASGFQAVELKKNHVVNDPRIGLIVSDSYDWKVDKAFSNIAGFIPFVNLWHGIPFKNIGHSQMRSDKTIGQYERYAWSFAASNIHSLITTSANLDESIWKPAFHAKHYLPLGYARNDVLIEGNDDPLWQMNSHIEITKTILAKKRAGYKIIVYMPTFYDNKQSLNKNYEAMVQLARLSEQEKVIIIVKTHPISGDKMRKIKAENIITFPPKGDIYPLLRHSDALLTDLSSISFDYFLTDKPIFYSSFIKLDRGLCINYDDYTPGKHLASPNEVIPVLTDFNKNGTDEFAKERRDLCKFMHKYQDAKSSERLTQYIENIDISEEQEIKENFKDKSGKYREADLSKLYAGTKAE